MRWAAKLILLILALPPFFVSADSSTPWVAPKKVKVFYWGLKHPTPELALKEATARHSYDCGSYISARTKNRATAIVRWSDSPDCSEGGSFLFYIYRSSFLQPQCIDPKFSDAEDIDGDGNVDHCHKSECSTSVPFWSIGNGVRTPSGNICVKSFPNGNSTPKHCAYKAITNDDGARSFYTFQPTGQFCDCSSEAVPCRDINDGEVTNYPQGQNGCVQLADAIMCDADEKESCPNGVCKSGCGKIGERFVCLQTNIPKEDSQACKANDPRPGCATKQPDECPAGALNCITDTPPENSDTPACTANDPRPECSGKKAGQQPANSNKGVEQKLDLTNKNLKSISDTAKNIADNLGAKLDMPGGINPDSNAQWSDIKSHLTRVTSPGDENPDQAKFKKNFSPQQGFFNQQINGLVPSARGCQPLTIQLPMASGTIDACSTLAKVKLVLEWVIALLFIIYVRSAFMRLKPNGA